MLVFPRDLALFVINFRENYSKRSAHTVGYCLFDLLLLLVVILLLRLLRKILVDEVVRLRLLVPRRLLAAVEQRHQRLHGRAAGSDTTACGGRGE